MKPVHLVSLTWIVLNQIKNLFKQSIGTIKILIQSITHQCKQSCITSELSLKRNQQTEIFKKMYTHFS